MYARSEAEFPQARPSPRPGSGQTERRIAPRTTRRPDRPSRILVADDEYLIAADLAFILNSLGYTVVGPVADGRSALDEARRTLPDLALLDVGLPFLDGIAVAKSLIELEIPCVVLSGYGDQECVQAAHAAGVCDYLIKPVQIEQLRAAIDAAWRRFCRYAEERQTARSWCDRLEQSRVVDRAAGVLASACGISEQEAQRLLIGCSDDSCRSIASLAEGAPRQPIR